MLWRIIFLQHMLRTVIRHSKELKSLRGGGNVQDVTAAAVAATGKGCYWNQDVKDSVLRAGLIVRSKHDSLGGLITSLVATKH